MKETAMNRCLTLILGASLLAIAGCGVTPPNIAGPKKVNDPRKLLAEQGYPVAQATFTSAPAPLPLPTDNLAPIKTISEKSEQEVAMEALGRIGTPAVPALTESLANPDAEVRMQAARTLARMGSDAKDAVPALLPLLDDPDERVRKAVGRALGQIGPDAAAAVPALVRKLEEAGTAP
jgi:hypothetical protein